MYKKGLLFTLLTCMAASAGEWRSDLSIRERLELFDGFNKKAYGNSGIDAKGRKVGQSNDTMLLQRIITGGRYETSNIDYSLLIYDARVWNSSITRSAFIKNSHTDSAYMMDPYREYVEFYDASITFKRLLNRELRLKIGRQDISMGDHRIIGPGIWGNSIGHLWDAARFTYRFNSGNVNLWYGQTRVKDPHKFSLLQRHLYEGAVAYGHLETLGKGGFEPFALYKQTLRPTVKSGRKLYAHLGYAGFRWYAKDLEGFNWDTTFAYEFGDSGGKDVRAYGYVIKGGYRFDALPLRPNIVVGRVYASGDEDTEDDTVKTFTTPFGSTDGGHYGRMDIMKWANLVDDQVNLHLEITSKTQVKLSCHDFRLAESADSWRYYGYKNRPGFHDERLGSETDVQLFYKPAKGWELTLIYACFNAGSFVRHNVADNDARRAFFQIQYQFKG